MGYKRIASILPPELIQQIQKYVDGEYIYIPRITERRKNWGDNTNTRQALALRNEEIFHKYQSGATVVCLAEQYHISTQGIYKILSKFKG